MKLLALACGTLTVALAAAAPNPPAHGSIVVSDIAPRFHVISDRADNLLLYTGESESMVVGVQKPALVERTLQYLAERAAPPVRYALAIDGPGAAAFGDGGWGARGALTFAHEAAYFKMLKYQKDTNKTAPAASESGESADEHQHHDHGGGAPRTTMPLLGFSRVQQVYAPAPEEVHFINNYRGANDADVIVHFETEGVLHLGAAFTMDGYPDIDVTRLGNVDGIIRMCDWFIDTFGKNPGKVEPIVPGRGRVASLQDLRDYRGMLMAVRDRVQRLVAQGQSLDEVLANEPAADFDATWGHGPVGTTQFVTAIHYSVTHPQARPQ